MKGIKTWLGIISACIYAAYGVYDGSLTIMQAIPYFIAAWTALGIGHKIEKHGPIK
ncbi:hypothetical protein [Caudoviricetes sp.]|nr:hypothetical protein [Caudoviricetes sp.]